MPNHSISRDPSPQLHRRSPRHVAPLPIGYESGRLVVIGEETIRLNARGRLKPYYEVLCSCGTVKFVSLYNLTSGNTTSCGCLTLEMSRAKSVTHGENKTRLYGLWGSMRTRCTNPRRSNAKNYIGRGIRCCEAWSKFEAFRDWSLENGYQDGLSLDRRDNNEGYCPENCRWVDWPTQCRNKRSTIYLEAFGETKIIPDWLADPRCKPTASGLYHRLKDGWSPEDAISLPRRSMKPK